MPSDTRIKMIDATVEALQRRGVAGMSFTDVLQHSAVAVVEAFLGMVRPVVTESAAGGGCAVAAITMAAGAEAGDALRQVAASAFGSWIGQLGERLATAGLPRVEAIDLSATLITLLEGAHVLCRAAGSLQPF